MRLCFMLVVVMALAVSSKQNLAQSNSQEPVGHTGAITQCEEEIKQKVVPIQTQYAQELEALAQSYQAKGELGNVIAVKNEQDRFMNVRRIEGDNIVPSPEGLKKLQTKYKALTEQIEQQIAKRYLMSLEQQQKSLTIVGKLDSAMGINDAIEKIQQRYNIKSKESHSPTNDAELKNFLRDTQWSFAGNRVLTLQRDGLVRKSWGHLTPEWRVEKMRLIFEGKTFEFSNDFARMKEITEKEFKGFGSRISK